MMEVANEASYFGVVNGRMRLNLAVPDNLALKVDVVDRPFPSKPVVGSTAILRELSAT
jgi:hypothetical protein